MTSPSDGPPSWVPPGSEPPVYLAGKSKRLPPAACLSLWLVFFSLYEARNSYRKYRVALSQIELRREEVNEARLKNAGEVNSVIFLFGKLFLFDGFCSEK
ncbi:hypothetical protein CEXT_506541 [Caerostris extrusa]|uniref:Uncharacterized protein n=1 Tax=Caerostris extrusa TaxID=172846 RepID=A0AAV4QRE9_CAEEX|nr:hypothetical protein CEXT_506541 [Caerostris extrusa]